MARGRALMVIHGDGLVMPKSETSVDYDVAIVGGGVYGIQLGLNCRATHQSTVLIERGSDLLARASSANQARVHRGYHYPRSLVTGFRSRANFGRFLAEFKDCIDDRCTHYYAVGGHFSKVTARQFELFCDRIGAPLAEAPEPVARLFSADWIEAVFEVQEAVFDATMLREGLRHKLEEAKVEVRLGTEAVRVGKRDDGSLEVTLREGERESRVSARKVFNCTYSRINQLRLNSGLTAIPLKHELAELALVKVPFPLEKMGVTVMCGPFFSLMPFPPLGLHSLSHVRYTPHCEWIDSPSARYRDPSAMLASLRKRTRYPEMIKDASRYLPLLRDCKRVDSLWEIKTVLPQSELDDSRPILFKQEPELPGFVSILGSKIDNVYDMIDVATSSLTR